MKLRTAIILGIVLLFGTAAFAQDYPRIEIPAYYSYMRFNPENSNIVSSFSLNGGGGGITFFFNHFLGVTAEFNGYASTTQTFNFPAIANSPCPLGCRVKSSGDLFTYNFGPVLKFRSGKWQPFVEALGGGAHSNTYSNLASACQTACTGAVTPSNNAADFIIGGGLDIALTHSISIRPAQVDFVLTRFGNSFTAGNNNQSNLRYNGGIVFKF
jgi:hypothetical protein